MSAWKRARLYISREKKRSLRLIVPTGTFSEPCELSGTQADSGSEAVSNYV